MNRLTFIYKALIKEDLFNNVAFLKGINFNHRFVAYGEDLIQSNVET